MQICQGARSPFIASHFNFSYKTTFSPATFLASSHKRELVPESFRENGPSSRTNGTAQGKGRPEVLKSKQACCGGEEARGLVSQVSRDQKDPGQAPNCTSTIIDWAISRRFVSWPPLYSPGLQP